VLKRKGVAENKVEENALKKSRGANTLAPL
jgi:hypothetical protein